MRTIALRTKTVLAALAGAGVLTLGSAAAGPAAALEHDLVQIASDLSGHGTHGTGTPHTGRALADDKPPALVHS
ncbi:hypothetical protein AB5J72_28785 [Streptomyces sp. CG1]|uniref:hypothetical protein n=1 Tax=Streptomyces sp. CG1 TaxID=1287523 RepID=UPI0034E1D5EB